MKQLISVELSRRANKRFVATFVINGKVTYVHFGAKSPDTYIDHHDQKRKNSFLARTRNYKKNPLSPGNLAKGLLWGDYPNLEQNLAAYKKEYDL